jgi:hypothetical protein
VNPQYADVDGEHALAHVPGTANTFGILQLLPQLQWAPQSKDLIKERKRSETESNQMRGPAITKRAGPVPRAFHSCTRTLAQSRPDKLIWFKHDKCHHGLIKPQLRYTC